jgi:drug/metabolite transporter (DMT)-like permease
VTQLKVLQEAISLFVFIGFAWAYFRIVPNWRTGLAVLLIVIAVAIVPRKNPEEPGKPLDAPPAAAEDDAKG